jgi:hypothetical protein
MQADHGPPFPGGNTIIPSAGAVILALVWCAFTAFYLVHFLTNT